MSRNDNILRVPLIHLRDAAAEDLLAAAGESVGAGDGASIDAPHMDVGASTGHYITLHTDTKGFESLIQFIVHFFILRPQFIRRIHKRQEALSFPVAMVSLIK